MVTVIPVKTEPQTSELIHYKVVLNRHRKTTPPFGHPSCPGGEFMGLPNSF